MKQSEQVAREHPRGGQRLTSPQTSAVEPDSPGDRTKVLYIAGQGRSGSTLVAKILGELAGFEHVGELFQIANIGLKQNYLCGCGVPFDQCPTWKSILDTAYGTKSKTAIFEDLHSIHQRCDLQMRLRDIPKHLLFPDLKALVKSSADAGIQDLHQLYASIRTTTSARVVVDSSKVPAYAYLLQNTPGIDLYVLHLIRDPRAVAYSWSKNRTRSDTKIGEPEHMEQWPPLASALVWNQWNRTAERVGKRHPRKYMALRYEAFVRDPEAHTKAICRFAGEPYTASPFIDPGTARNSIQHTVWGNPIRIQSENLKIKHDREWKDQFPKARQLQVLALTWPFMLRYGYLKNES